MEPLILYASERFIDEACRALGVFAGKPLINIVKRMGVRFKELSGEEAKDVLDKMVEGRSAKTFKSFMSTGQLIKLAVSSFLWPPALLRRVSYLSGIEAEGYVMLEFQAGVPKMFTVKLPPPYHIWLIMPKTEAGAEDVKRLLKEIVKRVGVAPLNEGEWEDVKLIKERLLGGVEVRGAAENLWASL